MTGPVATAVMTLPRAGYPVLDLAAARQMPGVLAVVGVETGPADQALPAGHIVAALAAEDHAALRRGLAALALRVTPVRPVLEPAMPDLPLTLRAARGVSDPLAELCFQAAPGDDAVGPLPQRLAAELARIARVPLCLDLTAAEALAVLPQRPAVAVAAEVNLGPDGQIMGLDMRLNRHGPTGTVAVSPALAVHLPVALSVDVVETHLPPAWSVPPDTFDPAATALLELALQDHALARGLDPLAQRFATLPDMAQAPLQALQTGWTGPMAGRPADAQGRLRQGAGLAAGLSAAVHVELLVDGDTGHVLMPLCRVALCAPLGGLTAAVARGYGLALTEEVAFDAETGVPLLDGFGDQRLASSFTLPDIETLSCAPTAAAPSSGEIAALTAAAILTALRDALGQRPCHLPMTPDRVLALSPPVGAGRTIDHT